MQGRTWSTTCTGLGDLPPIPFFTSKRTHSQARLLRKQYDYRGVLRARANILGGRFDFMQRCIDALEVTKVRGCSRLARRLARGQLYYQPAGDTWPTASTCYRGGADELPDSKI
jgi:uncharacterized protein (DUF934 family)